MGRIRDIENYKPRYGYDVQPVIQDASGPVCTTCEKNPLDAVGGCSVQYLPKNPEHEGDHIAILICQVCKARMRNKTVNTLKEAKEIVDGFRNKKSA